MPENTYTAQQMDQSQQGHMEALELCQNVIEASTCQADRFNRIFGEYFPATDRELVLGLSSLLHHLVTDKPTLYRCLQINSWPPGQRQPEIYIH